ncbi:MAG: CapA family protein [Clostridia bacterium]|nr:CapA family protein [Clostridia bacterium]
MKLIIGGDICPTPVTHEYFKAGDVQTVFGTVPTLFEGAARVVANLECALTTSDTPIRKCGPNLRADPVCAQTLKNAGITDVSLSNNHTFDFGRPGMRETMKTLTEAGIGFTGVGENEKAARKPHYMEAEGKIIAVVAVCEHEYSYALPDRLGTWGFDPFDTMEDISIAAQKADCVIVLYHGGKEQCRFPSPRLRKACQAMVRAGADVVLCQHSHCIGCYENYRDGHILYGQGNFNFVEDSTHPHWQNGLAVELNIDDNNKCAITFHPVVVTKTGITLAEGDECARLLRELANRNTVLQNEKAWLDAWHQFCVSMAANYRRSVDGVFPDGQENAPKQVFPHYLDCEAHTDVWRELFPTWQKDKTCEQGTF